MHIDRTAAIRTGLGLAVVGGAVYVVAKRRAAEDAEDVASASLAKAFLPWETITPAEMRTAARSLRGSGGDAALATALDVAAGLVDSAAAAPLGPVQCRSRGGCLLYGGASVFSPLVKDADMSAMQALERSVTGWTRVAAPSIAAPPPGGGPLHSLVLDPSGAVGGWIRTDSLEAAAAAAAPTGPRLVSTGAATSVVGTAAEEAGKAGLWATSAEGMTTIIAVEGGVVVALTAVGLPEVGVFLAPVFAELDAGLEAVGVAIREVLGFYKAIVDAKNLVESTKSEAIYQANRVIVAAKAVPAIVKNAGYALPSDPHEIGTIKSLELRYASETFLGPFVSFSSENSYSPAVRSASADAYTAGIDADLELQKRGIAPQQIAAQYTSPRVREDAVALAMNSPAMLNRDLYQPDWYDPATGAFTTDARKLSALATYETVQASAESDPLVKKLRLERASVLLRQMERAGASSALSPKSKTAKLPPYKQIRRASPAPPPNGEMNAADLLTAYQASIRRGMPDAIQKALLAQYTAQQTREVPDRVPTTTAARVTTNPEEHPGFVPSALARGTSLVEGLVAASILTAPIWIPFVLVPIWRRSHPTGLHRSSAKRQQ